MANQKISQLTQAVPDGTEYTEVIISPFTPGTNRRVLVQDIVNLASAITREIGRAFSETLLFDKNEIEVVQHTMTADLTFVISTIGNIVDESSSMLMEIVADGVHAINFTSSPGATFAYIYPSGIQSGVILDAGTYEVLVLYLNGRARVNIPGVSLETSGLTALSTPGSFTVVADGENALDMSWTDVANEVEYQIERSLTGTGGWTVYSNPVAGATSDTETGLTANTTIYYRIKAVGDGVSYADSPYATANGTTADSGDVTAPTFTFNPANGNAVWTVNRPLTITANEELRNASDGSLIDSADLAATIITLKETNSGGTNIAFTATIDATKTIITITPTTMYGANQLVYLAINNVEDVSGNAISLQSITFTTTAFTYLNGTSNRLGFGDILDSIWAAADTNFGLGITLNNVLLSGARMIVTKLSSYGSQRTWAWYYIDTDIYFSYWNGTNVRELKWTGAMTSGSHVWRIDYDGSIDTNNGLDRLVLLKDGVTVGSKTLNTASIAALWSALNNTSAHLAVGSQISNVGPAASFYTEEMKDFKVWSTAGSVVEINVPIIFNGLDTSGNARHGTWA